MTLAFFISSLVCLGLICILLKPTIRPYYFSGMFFLLGAAGVVQGLLDGINGNHWETQHLTRTGLRVQSWTWFQNLGAGVFLIIIAVFVAQRARGKDRFHDRS